MRTDSAVTEGEKNLQCTGALVDLDYSTQEAKYINLATVKKKKKHWSTSEEVCCIIFLQEMSTLDKLNLRGKEYL